MSLKQIFHAISRRFSGDPRRNKDGTWTTSQGHRIIPYRVEMTARGSFSSNIAAFMFQPRIQELKDQMKPLLQSKAGDRLALNRATGDFYLQSDIDRCGADSAPVLGRIDMALEEPLFATAAENVMMKKLFGDASHSNPVVVDEATGRVYPKNDPDQTRGYVQMGPRFTRSPK